MNILKEYWFECAVIACLISLGLVLTYATVAHGFQLIGTVCGG